MVKQYPHNATFWVTGGGSKDQGSGSWLAGDDTAITAVCRAEARSVPGQVSAADGKVIDYTWTVYLPKLPVPIATGTRITVDDATGATILTDTVKLARQNQLNAQVWL